MKRMQLQLPDWLYERLKRLAAQQEISLAEILRRGAEYMLSLHPEPAGSDFEWHLPEPMDLGPFKASEEQWRVLANEPEDLPE
jgi:hypothetical protein